MWLLEERRRIFAYTEPTDMRKSFQGLFALVQHVFPDQDPHSAASSYSLTAGATTPRFWHLIALASLCLQRSSSAADFSSHPTRYRKNSQKSHCASF